ncbi:glycosyl hydrolase [Stachybotrys elegans]|uniref:Glycosyl hydrolase n=1 Tax=Stachybotrys elegans TaxID=80388 RepID=A0A8K0SEG4_9HYPO|nr:glycosyl hydrolase [Stachybotrys elegans]
MTYALGGLSLVNADNPIVQTRYTADPAPIVHNGRVYVFTSHDEETAREFFDMRDWRLYSTDDMVNWLDHGSPLGLDAFDWVESDAWAGQVVERNGQFFWYVPMSQHGGERAIGVAVADTVTGPYVDAIGKPLIANDEIDPHTFIDDGQAYLYWGNPSLWYVALNDDMISIKEEPVQFNMTVESFGPRRDNDSDRPSAYEEGPWVYKHGELYYLLYASNCCNEDIRYSTAPTPRGPWTYRGIVMESQSRAFTNHPGYVEFKGNNYFFYHNGALPRGGGFWRSVAVEQFIYNLDGTIPKMVMTERGAPQLKHVDPYTRQEAELIAFSRGVSTEVCEDEGGGMNVNRIRQRDFIKVSGVDFGDGASSVSLRVASGGNGGFVQMRLDNWERGWKAGECDVPSTGGWQNWTTVSCAITGAEGVHDLFFAFYPTEEDQVSGYPERPEDKGNILFSFNWWQFQ